MNRITPTGHAEEVYQAKLNGRVDRERVYGPAGLPIPLGKHLYRKSVDEALLAKFSKRAFVDYRRRTLTDARRDAVKQSLVADMRRRFPDGDMFVLERYALAAPRDTSFIEILAGDFEAPEKFLLDPPILLPAHATNFHVDLGGRGASIAPPVPADTMGYFRDLVAMRREARKSFDPAIQWPGLYRTAQGRWPHWHEIERQFPLIGEWMEAQRNG